MRIVINLEQWVIDEIENKYNYEVPVILNAIDQALSEQPSKWIDTGSGQECSNCKKIQHGYDSFRHFCPNCGAKMKIN